MHGNGKRPKVTVSGDGSGVVSHSGSRLLADLTDRSGLSGGLSDALGGLSERRGGHDPGRVPVDLAVMLADGGTTISELAVLRHQPALFGAVASIATAWRVLDAVDEQLLGEIRAVRAAARERVWLQAADTGRLPLSTTAGGIDWPGLRLQLDATLTCAARKCDRASSERCADFWNPTRAGEGAGRRNRMVQQPNEDQVKQPCRNEA